MLTLEVHLQLVSHETQLAFCLSEFWLGVLLEPLRSLIQNTSRTRTAVLTWWSLQMGNALMALRGTDCTCLIAQEMLCSCVRWAQGQMGLGGRWGVPAIGGRAGLWTLLPVCTWLRKRLGAVALPSISLLWRSSS